MWVDEGLTVTKSFEVTLLDTSAFFLEMI
jgi:hypothetical protein